MSIHDALLHDLPEVERALLERIPEDCRAEALAAADKAGDAYARQVVLERFVDEAVCAPAAPVAPALVQGAASREQRAFAVLTDPRFHQAEWTHYGHSGPCPHRHAWGACRQFAIGLRLVEGRVSWLHVETAEEALERAAQVLLDGADIKTIPGYAG
jgi:hypothetical protein